MIRGRGLAILRNWLILKALVHGPNEPYSALRTTPRDMLNDRYIGLTIAQLFDRLSRINKSRILVQARATYHQPSRISEARCPLDTLNFIINVITMSLDVLMM